MEKKVWMLNNGLLYSITSMGNKIAAYLQPRVYADISCIHKLSDVMLHL